MAANTLVIISLTARTLNIKLCKFCKCYKTAMVTGVYFVVTNYP